MPTKPSDVADAFEKTGAGWILQDAHKEQILTKVARDVDEFIAACQQKFNVTPEPFKLLNENPAKGTGFFQAFTGPPHSIDMRLLIWDLLMGAEIMSVEFSYKKDAEPTLTVETKTAYGEEHQFHSNNLWDFRIFRHIGLLGVGNQVILDGYYGLRTP
jgi:hypothetical protein